MVWTSAITELTFKHLLSGYLLSFSARLVLVVFHLSLLATLSKHLEETLGHHMLPRTLGLDSRSPSRDTEDITPVISQHEAVMRASLVRCASKLIEQVPFRRSTVAVSDPAAQRAIREVAQQGIGNMAGQQFSGSDPFSGAVSRGRREGNRRDVWGMVPPHLEEEPLPWGDRAVTAASIQPKHLQ